MPSKKKAKPSYSVPEDIRETPQSGWVYRSESADSPAVSSAKSAHSDAQERAAVEPAPTVTASAARAPAAKKEEKKEKKGESLTSDIVDLTSKTFTSGMAAVGNALLLGARIVTAPFVLGMKMMGFGSK